MAPVLPFALDVLVKGAMQVPVATFVIDFATRVMGLIPYIV